MWHFGGSETPATAIHLFLPPYPEKLGELPRTMWVREAAIPSIQNPGKGTLHTRQTSAQVVTGPSREPFFSQPKHCKHRRFMLVGSLASPFPSAKTFRKKKFLPATSVVKHSKPNAFSNTAVKAIRPASILWSEGSWSSARPQRTTHRSSGVWKKGESKGRCSAIDFHRVRSQDFARVVRRAWRLSEARSSFSGFRLVEGAKVVVELSFGVLRVAARRHTR